MSMRCAWILKMAVAAAGLASAPAYAAGVACPQLAPTRLASLPPLLARRIETRVRLAVVRPRNGDIARVVRLIRRADPQVAPLAVNNYLIAISCRIIVAQTRGDEAAQTAATNAFASKVQKALY